jgi:hypothetical protein
VPWLLLSTVGACAADTGGGSWALVALLDARANLAGDASAHARALLAYRGAAAVAVQVLTGGDATGGWSGWRASAGATATRALGSGRLGGLRDFAAWAARVAGPRRLALAVLAHGVPPGDPNAPAGALLGAGGDPGVTISAAFAQLREGARIRRPPALDLVILECCFGSTLELLWEAREVAGAVASPPGELRSPGVSWAAALTALETNGWDWAPVLQSGAPAASGGMGLEGLGALTYVTTGWVIGAMDAMRGMCGAAALDSDACLKGALWARSRSQLGQRLRQLVDAGELAAGLEAYAGDNALRGWAAALGETLQAAAGPGRADQVRGRSGPRCGVAVYLPVPVDGPAARRYASVSGFAAGVGYRRFLDVVAARAGIAAGPVPWLAAPEAGVVP